MGIFSRSKRSDVAVHSTATRGKCACLEHIEDLLTEVSSYAPVWEMVDVTDMTVGDLIECEALGVDPSDDDGRNTLVGPFHWRLWVGDEARSMYDDDAAVQLDEALLARPGVELVEWEDREVFHVSSPTLCADGILAAAARALMDPRVKI